MTTNRVTPTNRAMELQPDEFIVSKTDTQGRITYANRVFMRLSGYTEAELLGANHNILRHPDMPKGVYKLFWDTISQGGEFFGFVKNLCKTGDHYWVFATVTPDFDARGRIEGYFSVRRRPAAGAVERITPLYEHMLDIERRTGGAGAAAASLTYLQEQLREEHAGYEPFVFGLQA